MSSPPPPPSANATPSWIEFVKSKKAEARPAPMELANLRAAALQRLGGKGDTWADRLTQIDQWWTRMKADEHNVTWDSAFLANRMTARAICISREARYGRLEIGEQANPEAGIKKYAFLSRDPESIAERLVPGNFAHAPGAKSQKDILGLHAQSASLLHSGYSLKEQIKFYANPVVMFFPAPSPEDMQIFDAISHLPGADPARLIDMRAKMTRIEGAWHGDMHTTLTYTNGPHSTNEVTDRNTSIRYGLAGVWKDTDGVRGVKGALVKVSADELAARYLYALQYPMILSNPSEPVNEIVMSYRQHNSSVFPLYAQFSGGKFMICKPTPTHEYAELVGKLRDAWRTHGATIAFDNKPDPSHTLALTGDYITLTGEYVKAK
jgi:hypothetical protein